LATKLPNLFVIFFNSRIFMMTGINYKRKKILPPWSRILS
jgi:hypothetical protein